MEASASFRVLALAVGFLLAFSIKPSGAAGEPPAVARLVERPTAVATARQPGELSAQIADLRLETLATSETQ
ncbi:MAG: hypothetical protein OES47_12120, partial [Acidobacteriota bacterium]|nr:hypothetical protein [Acidobacteriota bacterium]